MNDISYYSFYTLPHRFKQSCKPLHHHINLSFPCLCFTLQSFLPTSIPQPPDLLYRRGNIDSCTHSLPYQTFSVVKKWHNTPVVTVVTDWLSSLEFIILISTAGLCQWSVYSWVERRVLLMVQSEEEILENNFKVCPLKFLADSVIFLFVMMSRLDLVPTQPTFQWVMVVLFWGKVALPTMWMWLLTSI